MNQDVKLVGPRGWAIITLAGGVAFAAPFMRASSTPPSKTSEVIVGDGWSIGEGASVGATDSSFSARIVSGPLPSVGLRSEFGSEFLGEFRSERSPVTPATTPPLPSWASPPSQLDNLIANGPKTAVPSVDPNVAGLQAMVPWQTEAASRQLPKPSTMGAGHATDTYALHSPFGPTPTEGTLVHRPEDNGSPANSSESGSSSLASQTRILRSQHQVHVEADRARQPPPSRESASHSSEPRQPQFVFQPGMKE